MCKCVRVLWCLTSIALYHICVQWRVTGDGEARPRESFAPSPPPAPPPMKLVAS